MRLNTEHEYITFVEEAKAEFKESFIEDAAQWKERLKMTNSIVVSYMEEEGITEPFLLFTYDEYCQLCESVFNRILDNQNFRINYGQIYSSEKYIENLKHCNYDVDLAFDKTKEHFAELYFKRVLNGIEQRILIDCLKRKCGCRFPEGGDEKLQKMFGHEVTA